MYRLSKQERQFRERMRGCYAPDLKWYGVMTHFGREREVRDRIVFDFGDDGAKEVLVPELEASSRNNGNGRNARDLLFPSYVFVRCVMNDEIYMTVSAYRSVYSILGRAYRIPSVIEDQEMTHFKGVLSSCPPPTVNQALNVGAEAIVTEGLMQGMRGRVVEFNSNLVKIETCFSFFDNGRSVIVSIPGSDIRLDDTGFLHAPQTVSTGNADRR